VSLSEVEQLISIAKRQLYLLGNVKGASIALSQAIELLEGTEKPSLLNLRTALEKDLSEIKALPSDDLLKLAISLDSVVNSVESLPLLSSAQATTDQTLAEMTEDPARTRRRSPAQMLLRHKLREPLNRASNKRGLRLKVSRKLFGTTSSPW
jgi:uncharacterized protein HemX